MGLIVEKVFFFVAIPCKKERNEKDEKMRVKSVVWWLMGILKCYFMDVKWSNLSLISDWKEVSV